MKRRVWWGVFLLAATLGTAAATEGLPEEGVRAESGRRLDEALEIYRGVVKVAPGRADVWLRMADIYVVTDRPELAADALGHAARARPKDAELQVRWSQALAANNRPQEALAAIRRAVALDPLNAEYLKSQAQIALWCGDEELAELSYRTWLQLAPGECKALRPWAQMLARRGDLDAAVVRYQECQRALGNESEVRLELASVHGYRGDFAAARRQLDLYRIAAGDTDTYRQALAELEVRSGRPEKALELVGPLLERRPQDYELQLIRAMALHAHREPGPALAALEDLQRLGPTRPETQGMSLQVRTPQRSSVGISFSHYADSNDLEQTRYAAAAGVQAGPDWRWSIQAGRVLTSARIGSGLEAVDGSSGFAVDRAALGFRYQASPAILLEGGGEAFRPDQGESLNGYLAGLRWWPGDRLELRLLAERDLLLASPRASSLGIGRHRGRMMLDGQLGNRGFLAAEFNHDRYDDGNQSDELLLGPRFAVARNAAYNLDLGVRGHWLRHDLNAGSGYYAPADFRRYWATASFYYKLSENSGLGLAAGFGVERDVALDSGYRQGGDASIEGTFGIFRDWQLRVWGGAGGRLDSAAFQSDTYHGRSAGLEILRRF